MTSTPVTTYLFQDEFTGKAGDPPDPTKWNYETGRWTDNNELETYTDSSANCFQDGQGHLVLRAAKDSAGRFTSARLTTQGLFSHYGGVWEASIKLNPQAGLVPAWWCLGANYPSVGWPECGEVDMLESYGDKDGSGSSYIQTSVHTPNDAGSDILTKSADVRVDTGWHIYRMVWDVIKGAFTFSRDGVAYLTVSQAQMANWCFGPGKSSNGGMFMILNVAVGGNVAVASVPPLATKFPVDMMVDYIRVWDAAAPPVTPPPAPSLPAKLASTATTAQTVIAVNKLIDYLAAR
jgi:beta-glucanase (GH16 family)